MDNEIYIEPAKFAEDIFSKAIRSFYADGYAEKYREARKWYEGYRKSYLKRVESWEKGERKLLLAVERMLQTVQTVGQKYAMEHMDVKMDDSADWNAEEECPLCFADDKRDWEWTTARLDDGSLVLFETKLRKTSRGSSDSRGWWTVECYDAASTDRLFAEICPEASTDFDRFYALKNIFQNLYGKYESIYSGSSEWYRISRDLDLPHEWEMDTYSDSDIKDHPLPQGEKPQGEYKEEFRLGIWHFENGNCDDALKWAKKAAENGYEMGYLLTAALLLLDLQRYHNSRNVYENCVESALPCDEDGQTSGAEHLKIPDTRMMHKGNEEAVCDLEALYESFQNLVMSFCHSVYMEMETAESIECGEISYSIFEWDEKEWNYTVDAWLGYGMLKLVVSGIQYGEEQPPNTYCFDRENTQRLFYLICPNAAMDAYRLLELKRLFCELGSGLRFHDFCVVNGVVYCLSDEGEDFLLNDDRGERPAYLAGTVRKSHKPLFQRVSDMTDSVRRADEPDRSEYYVDENGAVAMRIEEEDNWFYELKHGFGGYFWESSWFHMDIWKGGENWDKTMYDMPESVVEELHLRDVRGFYDNEFGDWTRPLIYDSYGRLLERLAGDEKKCKELENIFGQAKLELASEHGSPPRQMDIALVHACRHAAKICSQYYSSRYLKRHCVVVDMRIFQHVNCLLLHLQDKLEISGYWLEVFLTYGSESREKLKAKMECYGSIKKGIDILSEMYPGQTILVHDVNIKEETDERKGRIEYYMDIVTGERWARGNAAQWRGGYPMIV